MGRESGSFPAESTRVTDISFKRFSRNIPKSISLLSLCLALAIVAATPSAWCADDQEKAEKQLRKVTALAMDPAARPLVSQTVAEFLKVPRPELVRERHAANLTYGEALVAYRMVSGEVTLNEIGAQMHAGKTIWEIANARHADWRQIAGDAKKLNDRIEAAFYNFFKDGHPDSRAASDGYDVASDSIARDREGLTPQDIASAQDTYARCFRRARGDNAPSAEMPDQHDHTPPQATGDPR
jgi:hypothetical protein